MNPRILLVDDHEVVREGVRSMILRARPDWEVCGQAADGQAAIAAALRLKPDLIILDITMPRLNGLEACAELRKQGCKTPVLIFSMHESARMVSEAAEAGAQGFVAKAQAARDLITAIETLLGGGAFFGGSRKPRPDAGPSLGILVFFFGLLPARA